MMGLPRKVRARAQPTAQPQLRKRKRISASFPSFRVPSILLYEVCSSRAHGFSAVREATGNGYLFAVSRHPFSEM
jgi:hypothetical protein